MSSQLTGALVGAAVCVVASPYLARLTLSVPDRERTDWWRGTRPSTARASLTAVVAVIVGGLAGAAAEWSALLPAFVVLALASTALVLIDFEHHRLPDRLVVVTVVGAALLVVPAADYGAWHEFLRALEAGVAVGAVLFLLAFISPKGFGLGDVKLGAVLGAFLGWFGWVWVYYGIFAGFLLGSVVGIALLISRRGNRKTAIPFGPMLVLGPLIVLAFDLVPASFR